MYKQLVTDITKAYRSNTVTTLATASIETTSKRTIAAFSHMSDNDPETLEKEKHKILTRKVREWNEKLASHSEAAIKADKDYDKPVSHLQTETIEHLEKIEREEKEEEGN